MQLSLASTLIFTVAHAMTHASTLVPENEDSVKITSSPSPGPSPSPKSSRLADYTDENAWENEIDEEDNNDYDDYREFVQNLPTYPGISVPKNDFPFDIVSLIFESMSPEEAKRLNFTDAQKSWYVNVLDGLIKRRPNQKIPQDINSIIYAGMDEETKKSLGLTEEQNKWFAGVIKDLTDTDSNSDVFHLHDMKQEKPEFPSYSSLYEDFERFYGLKNSTNNASAMGVPKSSSTGDSVPEKPITMAPSPKYVHDSTRTGTTPASKNSKTNTTSSSNTGGVKNSSVASASGARAVKDTWAVLGGLILGAMLMTL